MDVKVKSLGKAMEVLECFSAKQPELGVTEIARMTGMHKSSVHNILCTFEQMGYVSKNEETNRYYLGFKLVSFSYIVTNHLGLNRLMMPYLKKIANTIHEIVYLGIPAGNEVLYIDSCADDNHLLTRNILGERAPMYCTGLGKVMLAHHEAPFSLLPEAMESYTENTITDKDVLLAELALIKARGYAVDNMEHEFGVRCVAMPVFGADEQLRCAVSVSGPSLRFSDEDLPAIAAQMQGILRDIQHHI